MQISDFIVKLFYPHPLKLGTHVDNTNQVKFTDSGENLPKLHNMLE